jgi:hypothetical protein
VRIVCIGGLRSFVFVFPISAIPQSTLLMRVLTHTLSNTFLHIIQQTLSQTMNNSNNNNNAFAFALSPRKRAKHEAASEPAVELQCDGDPAAVHPAGAGVV